MDQKPSINYVSQFAFLMGLMGVFIVLTAFLIPFTASMMLHVPFLDSLKKLNLPENANAARLLNTMASFLVFLLPPLALARIMNKRPFAQLGFNTTITAKQIFLVVVITFASMILSGALGELNERIPISAASYAKAKKMEDAYKESMMAMATMKTTVDYLLGLLVLAFAPALFEEVLFRGAFQRIFIGWTKNKWIGIIITSILFSAIHISYFGFLPRLALGFILGLIFYYSKNIWLNILLHFLNNAVVVTQLYVMSRQGKTIDKTMDESMPIWWGAIGVVVLIILFRSFRKESAAVLFAHEQTINSSPENILS